MCGQHEFRPLIQPLTAVVEFGAQGAQTRFDVAQALAVGQLREAHDQELLVGGERAHPMIAVVTANTLVELLFLPGCSDLTLQPGRISNERKRSLCSYRSQHPLGYVATTPVFSAQLFLRYQSLPYLKTH